MNASSIHAAAEYGRLLAEADAQFSRLGRDDSKVMQVCCVLETLTLLRKAVKAMERLRDSMEGE